VNLELVSLPFAVFTENVGPVSWLNLSNLPSCRFVGFFFFPQALVYLRIHIFLREIFLVIKYNFIILLRRWGVHIRINTFKILIDTLATYQW
jgi:hypothetical protein